MYDAQMYVSVVESFLTSLAHLANQVRLCVYICVCMYVCVCMYMACITHIEKFYRLRRHIHMHACIHAYNRQTYIHTHTHTYICTGDLAYCASLPSHAPHTHVRTLDALRQTLGEEEISLFEQASMYIDGLSICIYTHTHV